MSFTLCRSVGLPLSRDVVFEVMPGSCPELLLRLILKHKGVWPSSQIIAAAIDVEQKSKLYFYEDVDGADSPPGPPRHFYRSQCRVLEEEILIAEEILNIEKAPLSATCFWPQLALTELLGVVKLGRTLIQDCRHDEVCHKAYLRQVERTQAFAETLKEIVWCMSQVTFY